MSDSVKKTQPSPEPRHPAQTLHRHIGKPASDWTVEDIVAFVRDQDVRVLSPMHVGGDGWMKTLDFVPRDSARLTDVLTGGERADGSSLFGDLGIPIGASDIVMRPRISAAFLDPFAPEPRWRRSAAISTGRAGQAYVPHTTADGDLTPEAKWLIGGLVVHGAVTMAFGNRSRDSFVRLSQGKEAPGMTTLLRA